MCQVQCLTLTLSMCVIFSICKHKMLKFSKAQGLPQGKLAGMDYNYSLLTPNHISLLLLCVCNSLRRLKLLF